MSADRVSRGGRAQRAYGCSHGTGHAVTARGCCDRGDFYSPNGGPSVHGQTDRASQNLRRPSRDRHRERAVVQGDSRSATQNCARRWSIRPQRPRCSASSAARRRTCSRSSTPSSRAPRGFVGSMTWCCDSARGTLWFRGLILVPYPIPGRVEISIDEPQFRWMREHGTLHVPDVRAQNDFPMLGSAGGCRTLLGRSPSSAGRTHWNR